MGKEEILYKITNLVNLINESEKRFSERDVVYILVEIYKIKEREFESRTEIKKALRCISFFRDWVVHTHLNDPDWFKEKDTLNDHNKLLSEILSVIENQDIVEKIMSMWPSFQESLNSVTKDQSILKKEFPAR